MNKTVILLKNEVRGYASDVTSIAQEAMDRHKTLPLASLAISTAIAAFGPMGVMKKYGKNIATIKGDGPLKNIIVESNTNGDIRALVGNPGVATEYDKERFNEIPIELGIGANGTLKIVNEVDGKTFGGEVKLAKGDVVTDLAYYYDQSEQIYSAVQTSIVLESPNKIKKAFAVIYQLLPKHNEGDVQTVEDMIKNKPLKNYSSIDEYVEASGFEKLGEAKLQWKCTCNIDKIKNALKAVSQEERESIIEEHGKLEVTCNFCNKKYDLTNEN